MNRIIKKKIQPFLEMSYPDDSPMTYQPISQRNNNTTVRIPVENQTNENQPYIADYLVQFSFFLIIN